MHHRLTSFIGEYDGIIIYGLLVIYFSYAFAKLLAKFTDLDMRRDITSASGNSEEFVYNIIIQRFSHQIFLLKIFLGVGFAVSTIIPIYGFIFQARLYLLEPIFEAYIFIFYSFYYSIAALLAFACHSLGTNSKLPSHAWVISSFLCFISLFAKGLIIWINPFSMFSYINMSLGILVFVVIGLPLLFEPGIGLIVCSYFFNRYCKKYALVE